MLFIFNETKFYNYHLNLSILIFKTQLEKYVGFLQDNWVSYLLILRLFRMFMQQYQNSEV